MIWLGYLGLCLVIAGLSRDRPRVLYPALLIPLGLLATQSTTMFLDGQGVWLGKSLVWAGIALWTSKYNPPVALCHVFSGLSYLFAFGSGINHSEGYPFFLISDIFGIAALILLGGGRFGDLISNLVHSYNPVGVQGSRVRSKALFEEEKTET